MSDHLKTDLAVRFERDGSIDLDLSAGELGRVSELDNLAQALKLRLLTDEGVLTELGHRRYGSKLGRLIGERLDRANISLLRRYTRQALLRDFRVKEVIEVVGRARTDTPGVVELMARVRAIDGQEVRVGVAVDLN